MYEVVKNKLVDHFNLTGNKAIDMKEITIILQYNFIYFDYSTIKYYVDLFVKYNILVETEMGLLGERVYQLASTPGIKYSKKQKRKDKAKKLLLDIYDNTEDDFLLEQLNKVFKLLKMN